MAGRARTVRLFVALWPDAAIRTRLAVERDRWRWPADGTAAPVDPAGLHVTLHFIGAVASDRLTEVRDDLRVAFEPSVLRFGTHALWPNGIAALEPTAVPPAISALHASLARALEGSALPVERRRYRPHVTLARRAQRSTVPPDPIAFDWPVDRYALVESRPAGGGYVVLAMYP